MQPCLGDGCQHNTITLNSKIRRNQRITKEFIDLQSRVGQGAGRLMLQRLVEGLSQQPALLPFPLPSPGTWVTGKIQSVQYGAVQHSITLEGYLLYSTHL